MDLKQAVDVLCLIRDGVDPGSGESLPTSDTTQRPQVLRALYTVLAALDYLDGYVARVTNRATGLPVKKCRGISWMCAYSATRRSCMMR